MGIKDKRSVISLKTTSETDMKQKFRETLVRNENKLQNKRMKNMRK